MDIQNNNKIKELRIKKGFSQEELAGKSGLSVRTIQRIENNDTIPRGESLQRIATALQVKIEDFFYRKKQEDKSIITILILSQLSFLIFPLLGIILPLIIWSNKKDKINKVDTIGKSILNFQITWIIIIFVLLVISFFNMTTISRSAMLPANSIFPIFIIGILFLYNFVLIIFNTIIYKKRDKIYFFPTIRFFS